MAVRLTNNAYAQIPAAVSAGDISITLAEGEGARFPELGTGDWFFATLLSVTNYFEIVRVTERFDDVLTVERGAESTVPLSFPANSRVELRVTSGNVDVNNQNVLLL